MPGQSALRPGSTRFSSPASAPVCYGQARLGWPPDHGFPSFFNPLASPAKAWLVAGLTSAFRPGFGPGLPRSGQAPDAREVLRYLFCLHCNFVSEDAGHNLSVMSLN